jgi:hypothetical protein
LGFLERKQLIKAAAAAVLIFTLGCSGGVDLVSVASSLAEAQRLANLNRTTMDGIWRGFLQSVETDAARQTMYLVLDQEGDITLVQSLVVLEDIEVSGTIRQDTFMVQNGIFDEYQIRFNISPWPSGTLVSENSHPVLFEGQLSENTFVSGKLTAGASKIAIWEADLFADTTTAL